VSSLRKAVVDVASFKVAAEDDRVNGPNDVLSEA